MAIVHKEICTQGSSRVVINAAGSICHVPQNEAMVHVSEAASHRQISTIMQNAVADVPIAHVCMCSAVMLPPLSFVTAQPLCRCKDNAESVLCVWGSGKLCIG